jgi:hypothetical protein
MFRAVEVLPQLQRLKFDWSVDLKTAISVQVEKNGTLLLHHSELMDPEFGLDDTRRWKAILNAIVPLPHTPSKSTAATSFQVHRVNAEGRTWLKENSLDRDFVRDAASVLRPGNSAILAILRESHSAFPVLLGYSHIVLHTRLGELPR